MFVIISNYVENISCSIKKKTSSLNPPVNHDLNSSFFFKFLNIYVKKIFFFH